MLSTAHRLYNRRWRGNVETRSLLTNIQDLPLDDNDTSALLCTPNCHKSLPELEGIMATCPRRLLFWDSTLAPLHAEPIHQIPPLLITPGQKPRPSHMGLPVHTSRVGLGSGFVSLETGHNCSSRDTTHLLRHLKRPNSR